jgi:hypothetical protein
MKYIGKYSSTMLAATIQCCQLVSIESKLYKHTSSKGAAAWFGKIGE